MDSVRRVALLMAQDLSFCRNVIRGVRAYALSKPGWILRCGPSELAICPYLRDWNPHGIIAALFEKEVAHALLKLRKPMVDIACMVQGLTIPTVDVDHVAIGRLAAQALLQSRFVNFGFFGSANAVYSQLREASFREELAKQDYPVSSCYGDYVHQTAAMINWRRMDQDISKWLRQLPKPVAIFASNDMLARHLADLCRQLGLHIPNNVALLGVDDDDMHCNLTPPQLSSVAIPSERVGYESAKLLDRLMSRGRPLKEPLFLPPGRVVPRQSTNVLAIDNPLVLLAVKYIRRETAGNIRVNDMVHEIGCGRRELERHFRRLLGRSILDEIRLVRIERAKELLLTTDLAMPDVASRSGFSGAERFAVVFRQLTGMKPTQYRRQSRIRER